MVPYKEFIFLSPILHEVCSSDLISNEWISLLRKVTTENNSPDWRNTASLQFQLLSDLCNLANRTIEDAVQRFISQSFIASTILTEVDFNVQLNTILDQFFQSTIIYFGLLIKTVRILTQIDQPYFGQVARNKGRSEEENLIVTSKKNITNGVTTTQVFLDEYF